MPSWLEALARGRRRVRGGAALFNAGDRFHSLYAVHGGFFKTSMIDDEGRRQVTGFFMSGDLLGLEGIAAALYDVTAVALEDSEVFVVPYPLIEQLSRDKAASQRELHIALSREIAREHRLMLLLGSMRAEERLAAFLLNLSARFGWLGYSSAEFHLRMTRADIGSYLGLTLETVSRLFSSLQERGILAVRQRHVRVLDLARLQALAGSPGDSAQG